MYTYLMNAMKTLMFNDYMSKIAVFMYGINGTSICIIGDFNADLSKKSKFGDILYDFCDDHSMAICDKDMLPGDTFT